MIDVHSCYADALWPKLIWKFSESCFHSFVWCQCLAQFFLDIGAILSKLVSKSHFSTGYYVNPNQSRIRPMCFLPALWVQVKISFSKKIKG